MKGQQWVPIDSTSSEGEDSSVNQMRISKSIGIIDKIGMMKCKTSFTQQTISRMLILSMLANKIRSRPNSLNHKQGLKLLLLKTSSLS